MTNDEILGHRHPVDADGVRTAVTAVLPPAEADALVGLLSLLSDRNRVRLMFALGSVAELCVGDLALALDLTADQASYALKQLRAAGLVSTRRDGRVIYYRLADGFPHQLLDHCLRQLLTISDRERSR
jgi:DNA-binding transcriptional ArsR family regulator